MALDHAKLRSLELYAKRKAMAEGTGDTNEKAMALKQLQEMEAADPGLRSLAARVEAAMNPSPFGGGTGSPFGGFSRQSPGFPSFKEAMQGVADVFAQPVADRLAHEARSLFDTPEPLPQNYKTTPLPAPEGEERVEVRWKRNGDQQKLQSMVTHLERRVLGGKREG